MPTLNKKDKELKGSDKKSIVEGVYDGKIKPDKLSEPLYIAGADKLKQGLYKGYGGNLSSFELEGKDYEMLSELRDNIYMFSAAKNFQQTLEMTDALVDGDGNLREFKDFKETADAIYEKYYGEDVENENPANWLKAEYDTAIGQARAASKWTDIQKNKDLSPFLKYSAVMDDHTCDICAPLDELIARVDDPVWDDIMPLNHFECNCTVEQLDEDDVAEEGGESDADEISEAVEKSGQKKNPLFNMNPGKDKAIFKDTGRSKHPYFEVPAKYRELAADNFNLPIPDED